MSYESVISRTADRELTEDSIKSFIDTCFIEVLEYEGKTPDETQARATITGDVFELCVLEVFSRFYPSLSVERSVQLDDACMTGAGGADFVVYDTDGELAAIIEAKGSADRLEWSDGTVQEPSRPGLKRSDSMKKAVCQAYQASRGYPDVPFFVITSHPPVSGSARCVCDLAEGDIIDKVVSVRDIGDFDEMVSIIESAGYRV